MARGRGTDGEVWRGERLSQCCYSSFGSPAFRNELTGKIRGPGAPVWSLVGSTHFYCYCGHGPVDADLSPRCWLLSSLFRSLSRWVPQPPRCVATICRHVFSCVPNLASLFTRTSWRARLLTGLSHATGPSSRWKERANHYPAESLTGHLHQCVHDGGVGARSPPPPPPRLERLPIAWVTYWVLSNVMTIQFVLSRNSVWTWLGGAGFCKGGIGLVSSWCQNKLSSWFPSFIWCRRYSVLWCYLQRPVVLRFVVSITATPVYCVQGTLSRCCGCVSMVLEEGRVLVWQWNGSSCSVFWHV